MAREYEDYLSDIFDAIEKAENKKDISKIKL